MSSLFPEDDFVPRLRFAPSPTGSPHIGSLHTALFCWALARALDGDFIVRIDDTDPARNTPQAAQEMLDALRWLGLEWDEGPDIGGEHAPYVQSQRKKRHLAVVQMLLDSGAAYVDSAESPAPIRLRMPSDDTLIVNDGVRGPISFDGSAFTDPIIVRSDGSPLYHLASAVDDHDMGITHVVRGDDWLSSAPVQIQFYRALGWQEPVWIHLPLILNRDGQKLSKRDPQGGYLAEDFQEAGYLPQAVFNYLLLLGWSPDGERELVDKWIVRRQFRIERLSASPSIFDWDKLRWLNQQYLKSLSDAQLLEQVQPFLEEAYDMLPRPEWLLRLVSAVREELVTLADIVDKTEWAFDPPPDPDAEAQSALAGEEIRPILAHLIAELAAVVLLDTATAAAILSGLRRTFSATHSARAVLLPIRAALTGRTGGPPLDQLMALLGKQRTLERVAAVLR